jgi:LmbE family N-acetylglucosaminyl deacetylase
MRAALLVPHADDETLFASSFIMRYDPDIYVCYLPRGEDERETRKNELQDALKELHGDYGYTWIGGYEGEPALRSLEERLINWRPPPSFLDRKRHAVYYDHIIAPCPYEDGNVEHNLVGALAIKIYGPAYVTLYHTYGCSQGRVRLDNEVVLEPSEVSRKLRALACYRSQIEHEARRMWFTSMLDLAEWHV